MKKQITLYGYIWLSFLFHLFVIIIRKERGYSGGIFIGYGWLVAIVLKYVLNFSTLNCFIIILLIPTIMIMFFRKFFMRHW